MGQNHLKMNESYYPVGVTPRYWMGQLNGISEERLKNFRVVEIGVMSRPPFRTVYNPDTIFGC